jgi:Trypsin
MPNIRLTLTNRLSNNAQDDTSHTLASEHGEQGANAATRFNPAQVIPPTQTDIPDSIVGGIPTNEFPDCCAVGNVNEGFFCSGTLIASNLVVTAAHCQGVSQVFIGGSDVTRVHEGELIIVQDDIIIKDADLRVLVLERDSTVPPRHVAQGYEVQGGTALLVGFGNIDFNGSIGYGLKRKVEVPISSLDCSGNKDDLRFGCKRGQELVAGHRGLNRDSCTGDSGGPLYIASLEGDFFLLGATSRGISGTGRACGDGGIYVRVDQFLDEIRRLTRVDIEGPRL